MSLPAPITGPSMPSYLEAVRPELLRVEEALRDALDSNVHTMLAVSRYILDAGGKRIRPSLVLLSAKALGETPERAVDVAASVELIHMATLLHDDVIDGAESRRGRRTANFSWGNQVPVLAGDYMLAKATGLLARVGDLRLIQALSEATTAMSEGEVSQIETRGEITSLPTYLSIIRQKTAEFMSGCCRMGAILAGASKSQEEALAQYGINLGMAFQITDDLLDFIGDPAQTGKPVGGDIREGKVTLPLILALEKSDSPDRASVERIIQSTDVTADNVGFVRKLVQKTGAAEATRQSAHEYCGKAVGSLSILPKSEITASLELLAEGMIYRSR